MIAARLTDDPRRPALEAVPRTRFAEGKRGMMTDLAIAPAHTSQTMPQQIANMAAGWLKCLSAFRPVRRSAAPPASELAGITRIDHHDIAPWLSF